MQSHIGLIPTYVQLAGGMRAYGRTADQAMMIYRTLKRMEEVGLFAVEVECITAEVLEAINDKTSVVTFSISSGAHGHAIFSFVADICGEPSEEAKPPRHAHAFGDLGRLHVQMYTERVAALEAFHDETTSGNFPFPQSNTTMHPDEHEKFLEGAGQGDLR